MSYSCRVCFVKAIDSFLYLRSTAELLNLFFQATHLSQYLKFRDTPFVIQLFCIEIDALDCYFIIGLHGISMTHPL